MHVGHSQPLVACFGAKPAAPQLKVADAEVEGAVGAFFWGAGSSHETHLTAPSWFETMQVGHSQPPEVAFGARPAASQLNFAGAEGEGTEAGGEAAAFLGASSSHETHFSAPSLLLSMHVGHDHPPEAALGAMTPAAPQLNAWTGTAFAGLGFAGGASGADGREEGGAWKALQLLLGSERSSSFSNRGRSAFGRAATWRIALEASEVVGRWATQAEKVKAKTGRRPLGVARAAALGS